jgi:hypothetical protein
VISHRKQAINISSQTLLTENFLNQSLSTIYKFDEKNLTLKVENPRIGNWFSSVFIDSFNKNDVKCSVNLTTTVILLRRNDIIHLNSDETVVVNNSSIFKYSPISNLLPFKLVIETIDDTKCQLMVHARLFAIPSNYSDNIYDQTCTSKCELLFDRPISFEDLFYVKVVEKCYETSYKITIQKYENSISNKLIIHETVGVQSPINNGNDYLINYYFKSNQDSSLNNEIILNNDHQIIKYSINLNTKGALYIKISTNVYLQFNNNLNYEIPVINLPQSFNDKTIIMILKACLQFKSIINYQSCKNDIQFKSSIVEIDTNSVEVELTYPKLGEWYLILWKECFDSWNRTIECPLLFVIPKIYVTAASDHCAKSNF